MLWFKSKKDSLGICYVSGALRSATVLLDLLIIGLVLYFIDLLFFGSFNFSYGLSPELVERFSMGLSMSPEEKQQMNDFIAFRLFFELLKCLISAIFVIYCWVSFGTTPAKWLLGAVIVKESDLSRITLKQAIKRFFGTIISALPLLLGFVWSVFDKRGQTWHDKMAGTVVVLKSSIPEKE